MKKRIYQWHRRLSLIIAIPLVLSAGSGLMHPIMTNIRPSVATQGLKPVPIDSSKIRIPLEAALAANKLDRFSSVRIIHIDTNWFYQVQKKAEGTPLYLSTSTGKILSRGDWLYAQYLARQFLEGPAHTFSQPGKKPGIAVLSGRTMNGGTAETDRSPAEIMDTGRPDCCSAATSSVLNAKGNKVLSEVLLTQFDGEYNDINRLLPVYRVSFDRQDGIRIYVETTRDRFAFAVDNRRAAFNMVFKFIHTWSWLDFLGKGRLVFEFLLVLIAFVTTVLGVYIFFSTRSKKVPGNGYVKARRNHRYTAIVVSLFTLMFTFSGGYRALYKLKDDDRDRYFVRTRFSAKAIHFAFPALTAAVRHRPVTDIGLVRLDNKPYWQVTTQPDHKGIDGYPKDLMKDKQASLPAVIYVSAADTTVLPDGEVQYARYLSTVFSGQPSQHILSVIAVTKFDNEYNFTDKRLPVWKVSYASNHQERYFVETSTGRLSVRVDDLDMLEGYSFAVLHKHEFLGWAGKWVKDTSTMFWAAAQIVLVVIGLMLYFKYRKRPRRQY